MPSASFISKYICIELRNYSNLPGHFVSFATSGKSGNFNEDGDFKERLEEMNHLGHCQNE